MIGRVAKRWIGISGSVLLLAGCAMSPQLQRVVVDHNQMVAIAEDELTLLNIIRASERFPLHFTAVTEVNGSAEVTVNTSLGSALVKGPNSYSAGLGANVSTKPNFKAAVLANENFQRGIQKPLNSELVAYYLDEGWRDETIMALFIERVEVFDTQNGNQLVKSIINYPEGETEFAALLCNFHLTTASTTRQKPLARVEQLLDRTMLGSGEVAAAGAASPATTAQRRTEISDFVSLMKNEALSVRGDDIYLRTPPAPIRLSPLPQSRCKGRATADMAILPEGIAAERYRLVPRFRSTLGIVYFLGEYVRAEISGGAAEPYRLPQCISGCDPPSANTRYNYVPLIDIRTGSGESLVDAKFRGLRYYVSADEIERPGNRGLARARSMQIIAIVQQLVNLNKNASDLPRSISVSGVN